tara:strand:+ start:2321 stop:5557 length:3237 start_codon:yes stop_codon:yes gene_type:complete
MNFFAAVGEFFKAAYFAFMEAKVITQIQVALTAATLVVGVKGFMQARNMLAKGQDILANKTSMGGKIGLIYGTRRVGAQIIYMDVSANDSRDMYVVYALSVGECDEILGTTIELDGNPLTDSARFRNGGYIGSDKISSGSGSLNTVSQNGTNSINLTAGTFGTDPTAKYRYVMNLHHGAASQTADPMLVASMPNWTTSHRLDGICYIVAHYGYDKEGMWRGVPQLTVQVRGKKVFDPRDNTQTFGTVSTYKHSDNPALCFLDYITNNEYGKGLTSSQINMSTFTAAANVCDTQVDQPYFNGSAQNVTWEGTAGNDFINITGTGSNAVWWQNKISELINLEDSSGNAVLTSAEIKDIQRTNFYDASEQYSVYFNGTLGSTYASQNGQSLLKVKRFHCNGFVDVNKNVMDNAKELLANMRGIFLYIDGKYELSIEDTGTSTFSINENHIIAESGIGVDYGNKDKKANKVIVEFFNANKKYELDTATVLHTASPFTDDDGGEVLEIKAEFSLISDPYIAYNMAKAILTRSRNQTTMQFMGTPEMYKLNVGDIVSLTYSGLGFNGKVCRVEALELQSNGLVAVSLIEYFDVYTWEVPPQEPVEELSNLPSAFAVKAPTGLAFTDSGSSSTARPFLSWTEPTDFPDHQYRIRIVDSSSNKLLNRIVDQEFVDLDFIPVGSNYVASVSSINTLGTESDAATLTFSVSTAPVATTDVKDDAITLAKVGTDVESAINAGGTNSTQLIKATSAPSTRTDGSSLQAQDIWADTDDNNQVYVRNSSNNGWEKARDATLVTLYNSLNTTVTSQGTALATAQSDIVTVTNSASANASSISSLTSTVGGNTSSITTNASAITNINGNAAASYVLKLNANGKVAQMVLNSNASSGSGATSTVAFLADTFKIDNDAGSSVSPFLVSGGSVFIDNARINNLSGTKIDVDTLAVKYFANVTSKIYNHDNTAVPLTRFGNTYTTTANSGGSGVSTHVPTTVTNCRSGGSFVAFLTGILGDVQNAEVEFSVNGGSSYSTCANGVQFTINAGTFRPYTLIYSDTLSFSSGNQTAIFRVRFNGKANYTQLGLTVLVDNTN